MAKALCLEPKAVILNNDILLALVCLNKTLYKIGSFFAWLVKNLMDENMGEYTPYPK